MGIARARVRDRILRRREILRAAGRVFLRKGFRLATMEDIAAAAGMAVGTLYHYFESKERLFATLLLESTQLLNQRLRAAAAKPLPPGLGLLAISRAYVDYFAEYPEYFRIQMFFRHEGGARGAFTAERKKIERLARQNLDLLAEKIREGQAAGLFRTNVDPLAAAAALWASYNGLFLLATNPPMLGIAGLTVEGLLATAAFLHFTGLNTDEAALLAVPQGEPRSTKVSLRDLQEAVRSAPWIDPATIFAGMRLAFRAEKARGVRATFEHRIRGPRGGTWTVRIDDGRIAVEPGTSGTPSVVFEISDENFIRLVTGQVEASELLMRGDLTVSGDLQQAALFRSFFLPGDAPPVAGSDPGTLGGGR